MCAGGGLSPPRQAPVVSCSETESLSELFFTCYQLADCEFARFEHDDWLAHGEPCLGSVVLEDHVRHLLNSGLTQ